MIGYITVGADDIAKAEGFYSAFLLDLGYTLDISHEGLSYTIPVTLDQRATPDQRAEQVDFYVKAPFDGQAASAGNGIMVAFSVRTQALVRKLHAVAVVAGGRNDGAPGFRVQYSAHFYVGYLRDPHGNKIALFCNSLTEPMRPD